MELCTELLNGMHIFGNTSLISDADYVNSLNFVYKDVLSRDTTEANINDNVPSGIKVKPAIFKQAHGSMVAFILEAAKQNLDGVSISPVLEDCKFTADRIETFNNLYTKHKTDLQILLSSTGYNPPHIVDVDWRLDYCIKSKQLESVNEPTYTISLKTETCGESGSNNTPVNFNCTQEQLQDLVGKLKDACKSVERSAQL